jgi:hypothetical protein
MKIDRRKWKGRDINRYRYYGNAWDDIPIIDQIDRGLLIEGYFDKSNSCMYLLFLVVDADGRCRLVRYIDLSGQKVIRYKEEIDKSIIDQIDSSDRLKDQIKSIEYNRLIDPITHRAKKVTDIALNRLDLQSIPKLGYPIEKYKEDRLQYFAYKQITPGAWYKIDRSIDQSNIDRLLSIIIV